MLCLFTALDQLSSDLDVVSLFCWPDTKSLSLRQLAGGAWWRTIGRFGWVFMSIVVLCSSVCSLKLRAVRNNGRWLFSIADIDTFLWRWFFMIMCSPLLNFTFLIYYCILLVPLLICGSLEFKILTTFVYL